MQRYAEVLLIKCLEKLFLEEARFADYGIFLLHLTEACFEAVILHQIMEKHFLKARLVQVVLLNPVQLAVHRFSFILMFGTQIGEFLNLEFEGDY